MVHIAFEGIPGAGKSEMINGIAKSFGYRKSEDLSVKFKQPWARLKRSNGNDLHSESFSNPPQNVAISLINIIDLLSTEFSPKNMILYDSKKTNLNLVFSSGSTRSCVAHINARKEINDLSTSATSYVLSNFYKSMYDRKCMPPDVVFYFDIPIELACERMKKENPEDAAKNYLNLLNFQKALVKAYQKDVITPYKRRNIPVFIISITENTTNNMILKQILNSLSSYLKEQFKDVQDLLKKGLSEKNIWTPDLNKYFSSDTKQFSLLTSPFFYDDDDDEEW